MGIVFWPDRWPHGLRCAECDHLFEAGEHYHERLESMTEGGIPVVLIVCGQCAIGVGA